MENSAIKTVKQPKKNSKKGVCLNYYYLVHFFELYLYKALEMKKSIANNTY